MKLSNYLRKLEKNKKALDPDFTDAIIAIIFTALIFIFAFIFISGNKSGLQRVAEIESENLEKNYILINYLRTPIEDSSLNIGEFLGKKTKTELLRAKHGMAGIGAFCGYETLDNTISQKSEDGILIKETENILENVKDWRLNMYIDGNEFCFIRQGKGAISSKQDITGETVMILIPSISKDLEIKIYFKLNIFGFSSLSSL